MLPIFQPSSILSFILLALLPSLLSLSTCDPELPLPPPDPHSHPVSSIYLLPMTILFLRVLQTHSSWGCLFPLFLQAVMVSVLFPHKIPDSISLFPFLSLFPPRSLPSSSCHWFPNGTEATSLGPFSMLLFTLSFVGCILFILYIFGLISSYYWAHTIYIHLGLSYLAQNDIFLVPSIYL